MAVDQPRVPTDMVEMQMGAEDVVDVLEAQVPDLQAGVRGGVPDHFD